MAICGLHAAGKALHIFCLQAQNVSADQLLLMYMSAYACSCSKSKSPHSSAESTSGVPWDTPSPRSLLRREGAFENDLHCSSRDCSSTAACATSEAGCCRCLSPAASGMAWSMCSLRDDEDSRLPRVEALWMSGDAPAQQKAFRLSACATIHGIRQDRPCSQGGSILKLQLIRLTCPLISGSADN
jgi:hypothetical protein